MIVEKEKKAPLSSYISKKTTYTEMVSNRVLKYMYTLTSQHISRKLKKNNQQSKSRVIKARNISK